MVVTVKKTVELITFSLTKIKKQTLNELFSKFRWCCEHLWDCVEYWDEIPKSEDKEKLTSINLHHLTYGYHRNITNLPANITQTARSQVFDLRKSERVGNIPIRFDNRTFTFKTTKKGNPIITISTQNGRIAIPIIQNRLWKRFQRNLKNGWVCNSVMINFINNIFTIQPVLTKKVELREKYNTVLGIDVGVGNFAAITVYDPITNKNLRQLYFGRDIVGKKRDISIRRSKLQSADAKKKLRKLKGYEKNYIKTRCYQIAHQIVNIAKEYNSIIAIEDIKGLMQTINFGTKNNRKLHRWAYRQFFTILKQIASQEEIRVKSINPRYTSQTCSRCGFVSRANRNSRHWRLFRCKACGFEVNADRNASINISKKLLKVRDFINCINHASFKSQITLGGMVVDPSVRSNEVICL